jgi:predicted dinucleotide-binding enzyme
MKTKQTIAVIGNTGNMQAAFLKALSKGNYRLLLCSNKREKMTDLENDIVSSNASADVETIECAVNAGWEADIIISSASPLEEQAMAGTLKEVVCQKIVISIGAALSDTNIGLSFEAVSNSAEQLQSLLPNSKVVKVVKTRLASESSEQILNGPQQNVIIAGEDKEAINTVSDLLSSAGFNPVFTSALRA